MSRMSTTWFLIIPLISAAAGLVGVLLGGWLSDRRERQKRHADFIHFSRGLFRLWKALSILWVVSIGGWFVLQYYGLLGENYFARFDEGYFLTRLSVTLLPPLALLGSGAVITWIVRAFRDHGGT